jgi:hypothetical protein
MIDSSSSLTGLIFVKKPSKEDAKIKPWTNIAKYKHKAEEALKGIQG